MVSRRTAREVERAAAALRGLDPDPPAVRLDDPPAHCEADAASLHAPLEAGEHREDTPRVLAVDPDAVVLHGHDPLFAAALRNDLDARRVLAAELQRVPDEVLHDPSELSRVGPNLREVAHDERPPRLGELGAEIGGDGVCDVLEGDALEHELARARVVEHPVHELARSVGGRPQLLQHVGRRRLVRPELQHLDEQRDPGERRAQVVRDDVGVGDELGLHPAARGDVVEEHDHAVAEPCCAVGNVPSM